jgi:hypothetical protein
MLNVFFVLAIVVIQIFHYFEIKNLVNSVVCKSKTETADVPKARKSFIITRMNEKLKEGLNRE